MWKNFWRNFGVHNAVRNFSTFNFSEINILQNFYSNQVYNHSLFSSHAFPEVSVRYFIYKKSSQVQKNKCNIGEIEVGNVGIGKNRISDTCP